MMYVIITQVFTNHWVPESLDLFQSCADTTDYITSEERPDYSLNIPDSLREVWILKLMTSFYQYLESPDSYNPV